MYGKEILVHFVYIISAILFIWGLKGLTKVRTARRGNMLASLGMLLAIVGTIVAFDLLDPLWMVVGLVIGGLIGGIAARRVQMTSMPELVAIFNGVGGGASVLVALSYVYEHSAGIGTATLAGALGADTSISLIFSILIGSITISGSYIAFAKLQGVMTSAPILFKGQNFINLVLALAMIAVAVWSGFVAAGASPAAMAAIVLTVFALVMGVLLVIPIGGADMPVVISLLNSYSGLAACATGFVLQNSLLIISGSLVGASGLILTNIMCKAMNRSLANVLFGGFGAVASGPGDKSEYVNVTSADPEEAAMIMENAEKVIIIPGYGLAVAQAQHICKELGDELEKNGTEVLYAIHPVAGRMPGHMNVLLAEASVPYEKLVEMDAINPEFKNCDVALIVGANDVVNPAAIDDPQSPIAGMPILNAHEARSVMVIKRSLSPGFAGIKNPLFELDRTMMLFGDAKGVLTGMKDELVELKK